MRSFFIALALLSLALLGAVAPAVAASPELGNSANTTSTDAPNTVSVQLSETVDLESWSYQDGEFRLTLDSKLLETVVVTDSGELVEQLDSGESGTYRVTQRSYDLSEGTTTVVFDATEYKGAAAVTISAGGDPYLIQSGSIDDGLTSGPYPLGTLQIAVLSGALSVALVVVYKTYRYSTGDDLDPERVA